MSPLQIGQGRPKYKMPGASKRMRDHLPCDLWVRSNHHLAPLLMLMDLLHSSNVDDSRDPISRTTSESACHLRSRIDPLQLLLQCFPSKVQVGIEHFVTAVPSDGF